MDARRKSIFLREEGKVKRYEVCDHGDYFTAATAPGCFTIFTLGYYESHKATKSEKKAFMQEEARWKKEHTQSIRSM